MPRFPSSRHSRVFASLRRQWAPLTIALLVGIAVGLSAIAIDLDRGLSVWRANLEKHPASGKLAFVEIDARSLAASRHWPWPRSRYAEAIKALQRAGAQTIAFDVDFSSASVPAEDDKLAAAIARSSVPIILPTFRQAASQSSASLVENLPLASLRRNSQLAAVNIYASGDGLVRSYPYGVLTEGVPRPSIGATLADAGGRVGQDFPLDIAIDPDTIPRVSFVDLIAGTAPRDRLRGRDVLIGASAIELGDRYPVPGLGVLPGALIQLLAAETLIEHSAPVSRGFLLPLLLALVAIAISARSITAARRLAAHGSGFLAIFLLPLASEWLRIGTFQIAPALIALAAGAIAASLLAAARMASEARLTDADTGLANRRALQRSLKDRADGAVTVLRLANYRDVASVFGTARAAEFVLRVAERVAFAGDGLIHRVAEDALAWVILSDDLEEQGQRIDAASAMLRAPFEISGKPVELKSGYGLASATDASAIEKAATAADRAIARSIRDLRYTTDMEKESEWRLSLAAELDQAIANGDIWVAYQPKYDIGAQRVCAAEALVRWRHATRGAIPPDSFIPALEQSGRIADLTLHVLERALSDCRAWAAQGLVLGVAVNLSALLPTDGEFIRALETTLARFPDVVGRLTLEVTESAALTDPDVAIRALDKLAALGLSLSIDDYGTGQSTLSYLKRLPAREIKIDKSFVLALDTSASDQAMVRSTIELAHALGFKVVAEGVERDATLQLLQAFGCDVAQGWHIGRPVPSDDLLRIAKDGLRSAA